MKPLSLCLQGVIASVMVACLAPGLMAQAPAATAATQPQGSSQATLQYLTQSEAIINGLPKTSEKDAIKPLADLRAHFNAMASAYRAHGDAVHAPVDLSDNGNPDIEDQKASASIDWKDTFSRVEDDLSVLIGGGSTPVGPTGAPDTPVGTAGIVGTGSDIGLSDLAPALKEPLDRFRVEVELFYSSALDTIDDTHEPASK